MGEIKPETSPGGMIWWELGELEEMDFLCLMFRGELLELMYGNMEIKKVPQHYRYKYPEGKRDGHVYAYFQYNPDEDMWYRGHEDTPSGARIGDLTYNGVKIKDIIEDKEETK